MSSTTDKKRLLDIEAVLVDFHNEVVDSWVYWGGTKEAEDERLDSIDSALDSVRVLLRRKEYKV